MLRLLLLLLLLAEQLLVEAIAAHDVGAALVEIEIATAQKRICVEILYACLERGETQGRA